MRMERGIWGNKKGGRRKFWRETVSEQAWDGVLLLT